MFLWFIEANGDATANSCRTGQTKLAISMKLSDGSFKIGKTPRQI
jgi:hypothetical protein